MNNSGEKYSLNEFASKQLLEKGIIVEEEADEEQKLFYLIMDSIKSDKLVLFINPTEKCNFRCKYCYETFAHGEMTKEKQKELIAFVRNNIHKYSGLHVAWFGGEPLLAKDCIRTLSESFIRICNFNKRRYEASMTTNGYLLNKEVLSELLDLYIKQFQITIDGTKDIHDRNRVTANGLGTYDKITQNLKEIKTLKRCDYSIIIRSNLTIESFKKIDEYLEVLESYCTGDNRFSVAIFKAGNWLDKAQEDIMDQLITNDNNLKEIYTAILNSNKKINLSTLFLNPGSGTCYAGRLNNYLICADGSLHKCTVTFEDPNTKVGEIKSGTIKHNNYFYKMISNFNKCKDIYSCFNAPICMGNPCPIKQKSGSNCSYFKDSLDVILQIFDKQNRFPIIMED